MASLSTASDGRKRIQFFGADGKRRSIGLAGVSKRQALVVKQNVEQLVVALITGHAVSDHTAQWVASLETTMRDRLAKVGLIPSAESTSLADFLDAYIKSRTDLKDRTIKKLKTTRTRLVQFLGPNRALQGVTPGDADDWRLDLLNDGLAENTVRKHASIAKQFFHAAVRKRLVASNPFSDLRSTVQPNPSRFYFVKRRDARKVLDACPDAQWRLIFSLSRYGGLRCPSEHLGLRWGDIDWDQERIRVSSPKTEHHPGRDFRMVPMFPELLPYLEECFELAEPGEEFVITRYRDTNVNLRTRFLKIIRRAGLTPWPKLFQNLRSSRQTELEESFPSHVVCAWIGNSLAVAAKHYLQVTDDHFKKAVQNPVQKSAVTTRKASHGGNGLKPLARAVQGVAAYYELVPVHQVAEEGLEPPTRGL
jgi:integrase